MVIQIFCQFQPFIIYVKNFLSFKASPFVTKIFRSDAKSKFLEENKNTRFDQARLDLIKTLTLLRSFVSDLSKPTYKSNEYSQERYKYNSLMHTDEEVSHVSLKSLQKNCHNITIKHENRIFPLDFLTTSSKEFEKNCVSQSQWFHF